MAKCIPVEKRITKSDGYRCQCGNKVTFDMKFDPKCGVELDWSTTRAYTDTH